MSVALEAISLTKQYRSVWALRDCDLKVPTGRVIGLVGPNGAGKTTLLHLAVGLLAPTSGEVRVFDWSPTTHPTLVLSRVGFLAQDRPLFEGFTVGDTLELGRHLNPRWDMPYAKARLARLSIPHDRTIAKLSGGQRAQVALTLALGKRPDLVLLDEPVSNLDPLARMEFLQELMAAVADDGHTVLFSSHSVADLERVCDHLVILADGRIQLAGDIEDLVRQHALVVGPRRDDAAANAAAIEVVHAERQTTRLVRTDQPEEPHTCPDGSSVRRATLEEIVLAYLRTSPNRVKEAA
jgi:ABC-2 type transport system ATP-binding protein